MLLYDRKTYEHNLYGLVLVEELCGILLLINKSTIVLYFMGHIWSFNLHKLKEYRNS